MTNDLTFESSFWGSCCNTFEEEHKHFVYARLMGLAYGGSGQRLDGYGFDAGNKRVLDIGGGPVSMLLKCRNLKPSAVCDPLQFPDWVTQRYVNKGILFFRRSGEAMDFTGYDEAWIYNVLQHVEDPELVIANAKRAAPVVRLFEWVNIPAYEGHPHALDAIKLTSWLGKGDYSSGHLNESGCYGSYFAGVTAPKATLAGA
jgi:hypothetical protein